MGKMLVIALAAVFAVGVAGAAVYELTGSDDDDAGLVGADARTETDGDVTTDGETESGGDGDGTTGDDDTTN